jgi:hypothetical protein
MESNGSQHKKESIYAKDNQRSHRVCSKAGNAARAKLKFQGGEDGEAQASAVATRRSRDALLERSLAWRHRSIRHMCGWILL